MLRKTLTILSLVGLVVSVAAFWIATGSESVWMPVVVLVVVTCAFSFLYYLTIESFMAALLLSLLPANVSFLVSWLHPSMDTEALGYRAIVLPFLQLQFGALSLLCGYATYPIRRRRKRRKLGLCLKCGYDLTGNTSGKCPECNTATPASV